MNEQRVLFRHHLAHFGPLGVEAGVLDRRYARGCSMANCRGGCCRGGVDVDLAEQARILANADLVVRLMDADQEKRPERWFGEAFDDPDFPARRAVSTTITRGTCVFSDRDGRCVLHKAEAHLDAGETLKPFYCRAYPVCIDNGVLVLDDHPCPGQTGCCGAVDGGDLSLFDVCEEELTYVLGAEGLLELRQFAQSVDQRLAKSSSVSAWHGPSNGHQHASE